MPRGQIRRHNDLLIRKMCGIAILLATTACLQLIANYVPSPLFVSFNLALIPLVLSSILYGISGGALTGLILGIIIATAPNTLAVFFPINPWATILLCILKTTLAGAIGGLIFRLIYKKNFIVATIVSALIIPIINSGIFASGVAIFFQDLLDNDLGQSAVQYLFLTMIGVNFLIEFSLNAVLSPTLIFIIKTLTKEEKFGFIIDNTYISSKKKEE